MLLDGVDVAVPLSPCLLRWEPVNGNVVDAVTDVGMVKDVVRRPHDDGKKKKKKKPKEKEGNRQSTVNGTMRLRCVEKKSDERDTSAHEDGRDGRDEKTLVNFFFPCTYGNFTNSVGKQ